MEGKIKGKRVKNILLGLPIYFVIDWEYNKIWYDDITRHILFSKGKMSRPTVTNVMEKMREMLLTHYL
jgi:hypothetical protein